MKIHLHIATESWEELEEILAFLAEKAAAADSPQNRPDGGEGWFAGPPPAPGGPRPQTFRVSLWEDDD